MENAASVFRIAEFILFVKMFILLTLQLRFSFRAWMRRWTSLLRQGSHTRSSFTPPSHSRCLSPAILGSVNSLLWAVSLRWKQYFIVFNLLHLTFRGLLFAHPSCFSASRCDAEPCTPDAHKFANPSQAPYSCFISGDRILQSSSGTTFPCHSSLIMLSIGCTSC